MSWALTLRLLVLLAVVACGWLLGRLRWLEAEQPSRVVGQLALYIFIPALLFRTTARVDLAALPWATVLALFTPLLLLLFLQYAWQHRTADLPPAGPGTRALAISFGNTVQVGIPMASALFGEAGLAIHVTLVSVHALVLVTAVTVLTELDLARHRAVGSGPVALGSTLLTTLHNTVVHPVMLPVLLGLACNAAGLPLPPMLDDMLALLASAVVPLCLVLIGLSLADHGLAGQLAAALRLVAFKLLLTPLVVLVVAHWGFRLGGLPLAVVVMLAALPIGSNAQIFAQRYGTLEAEVSAGMVLSTLAYIVTAPLWLVLLARLGAT